MVLELPDFTETHRSILQLQGQVFYIDVAGLSIDPASDFAQGVKTGPVDYDQRLHAFFIAVDDHSAGIGYDVVNTREDTGVYSNSELGVDSRRSKHLMAPPLVLKMRQIKGSNGYSMANQNRHPITGSNNAMLFDNGVLAVLFPGYALTTTDGFVWKRVPFTSDSDSKYVVSKLTQVFNVGGTWNAVFQCNEVTLGVVPGCILISSTDGATFTDSANIYSRWDTVYYNGSYYSITDTQIRVGAAFADDALDTLFGTLPPGRGQWFGPMLGPNGETDLYFTKAGRLYFAEPVGQTVTEVNLGPGFIVAGGCFFDSNLILTDGQTTIAYSSDGASEIIRDIGFQNFRFSPHEVRAGLIRALVADELNLYAALQHDTEYDSDHNETHILAYNGRGWHTFGHLEDFYVLNMGIGWVPPTGWPITHRGLMITGIRGAKKTWDVIRPTGTGNYTAWSGTYADVDELVPDDGTTDINGSIAGRESFTHSTEISIPAGMKITGVTWVARAGGGGSYQASLRIGGVNYDSTTITPAGGGSWAWDSYTWALSPATGVAFTAAEVNAMEFGVEETAGSGATNISMALLLVSYGPDDDSDTGSMELQTLFLPHAGSVPVAGKDHFAQEWDLYEGWVDGGFIDLRGTLYELMASGIFTATEYVEVYYAIDDDEDEANEVLLGTIDETGEILEFGVTLEGRSFRNYRLHFKGYASAPDEGVVDTTLVDTDQTMGDATARTRIGQGFKIDSTQEVEFAQLYIRKVGAPTDNLTLTIEADSAGAPSGTALATSDAYAGANFDTDYSWHTFKFSTPYELTGATQYWLVVRRSGAVDAANYWEIGADASAPTYADGGAYSYNPTAWSTLSSDLLFNVIPDRTKTADMRGFVVEYDKRPKYRPQMQIPIDANGMIKDGVPIDGEPATFERVYNKLIELWDAETLMEYKIGKIRSGLCKMVTMPITVENMVEEDADGDDARSQGTIIIQIIEPKPRRVGFVS